MSKARVDVSATVDDVEVNEAQGLQFELQSLLEEYGAEGQVALTFDNRDKKSYEYMGKRVVNAQHEHHDDDNPTDEHAPVETNSGQYL